MSSDREALLAAVIASPDDDVPRLVYADYIEELGGEANVARAAFIRAEIAAELLPADDPERERLETDAAGLFNRFGETWNREIPDWEGVYCQVRYRRGFAGELAATRLRLVNRGARLLTAAPFAALRLLALPGGPGWPSRWAGDLSRFVSVQFEPGFRYQSYTQSQFLRTPGAAMFDDLYREPTLTGVQKLILSGNEINNAAVELALRNLPTARFALALTALDLSDNRLTDAGLAYLAAARGLDRITQVNVRGNPITAAGVDVLRARFGDGIIA